MWQALKDWRPTASIDDDRELEADFSGPGVRLRHARSAAARIEG
jgi:hypothetical protein